MKFQKTVQIWGREAEIRSGELKLQCGQWVKCGGSPSARFVGVRGGDIWVAHGLWDSACSKADFLRLVNAFNWKKYSGGKQ
jgi:hypothetical protein